MTDHAELRAWLDDVQLSNQTNLPQFKNPGELKAAIRSALDALDAARKERDQALDAAERALEHADRGVAAEAERDKLRAALDAADGRTEKEDAMWFVYDPTPVDRDGPVLWGEFDTEAEAWEYANEQHPDDEGGDTKVLEPVKP